MWWARRADGLEWAGAFMGEGLGAFMGEGLVAGGEGLGGWRGCYTRKSRMR